MPTSPSGEAPNVPRTSTGARLLLAAQMLLMAMVLWKTGRLAPRLVPDSAGYIEFPLHSLTAALGDIRTPGYPLFLAAVKPLAADWAAVPIVQFLAYCGAVTLLFRALRPLAGPWARALIAGSLLFANILIGPESTVDTVATDFLAAALGVICVALVLLRTTRRQPSAWLLVAIAAASAAAWLVRPAYLFVVLLVPLLGALLSRIVPAPVGTGRWGRELCLLSLATLLPLVAWCGLRQAVVGRFGVVSFGGYNLIGITGQFLDEDLAAKLPADLQPLARDALERRESFPFPGPSDTELSRLNYERLERRYDDTMWRVFTPAATTAFGDDPRLVNTELKRLALEIIRLRPKDYAVWIVKAVRQSVRKLASDFVLNPVYLAGLFVVVALILFRAIGGGSPCIVGAPPTPVSLSTILFLIATAYAAVNLATVIIVCPPLGRFTDAAGLLFPLPLISAVVDLSHRIRSRQR